MTWLTTLDKVTDSQRPQLGGKAVSLARLLDIGYSVPRTLVLSTNATSEILRLEGLAGTLDLHSLPDVSKQVQAWIAELQLPPALLEEIAHETQSWGRYAVRSSAVQEDGETRSWAGILETCVDVTLGEVEDSIRQCLASLYSPASLKYAANQSLSVNDLAMAVILQEFVGGEVSGVVFSVDPVNHFSNTVIIEAASAAASKVTDGSLIPDHYTVEKLTGRILDVRKGQPGGYALSRAAATEIAHHITRLEREFGCPVDVEWTIRDNVFVPLQSRCVTTTRRRKATKAQAPQAYRFWWLDYDARWQFEAGIRSFQTETDVAANQLSDVIYTREGGASRCLISVDDVLRLSEIGFDLGSLAQFERFEAESDRCLNTVHHTVHALDNISNDHLTKVNICAHLDAIDAAYRRCVSLYRMCDPYATNSIFDSISQFIPAGTLIDIIAPWNPRRMQEAEDWKVLAGRGFDEGAAWEHAKRHPWLAPNLYSKEAILTTLHEKHRTPQRRDKRRAMRRGREFDEGGLPDSVREMLSVLRGVSDIRLQLKLAFTSFDFYLVDLYQAIWRIAGVPARELHAHYSIPDMTNLLSHNSRPAAIPPAIAHFHRGRVAFVKAEHADAFWQGRITSLDHPENAGNEIRGTVANHGKVSGRVHLLSCNDPDKANEIRQRMHDGDVLVSEMIQLNVMDLVQRAGGLITDEGGMLSHAAILAREMGIPCIVGTQRATQMLRNGDNVMIDTKDGLVKRVGLADRTIDVSR